MAAATTIIGVAGALAAGYGAYGSKRAGEKTGAKPPPTVDPEAEAERVRAASARARARARGGFGTSDTFKGGAGDFAGAFSGGGKGGKSLLGS